MHFIGPALARVTAALPNGMINAKSQKSKLVIASRHLAAWRSREARAVPWPWIASSLRSSQ
jgi:hypothetical protein